MYYSSKIYNFVNKKFIYIFRNMLKKICFVSVPEMNHVGLKNYAISLTELA